MNGLQGGKTEASVSHGGHRSYRRARNTYGQLRRAIWARLSTTSYVLGHLMLAGKLSGLGWRYAVEFLNMKSP